MVANPAILIRKLTLDAENGDLKAQSSLALLYYKGESVGVELDYFKSRKWALVAAQRGSSEAQSVLGNLYREGLGGEQNFEQAVYWLEKAVAQGEISAQYGLYMAKLRR